MSLAVDIGAITVVAYQAQFEKQWDAMVAAAPNGTVLHSRNFLNYHKDRFVDRSVLAVAGGSEQILGVMTAAEDREDSGTIVSHPGSSFGGLLTRRLDVSEYDNLFQIVRRHFQGLGYRTLRCKTTPSFIGDVFNEIPTHHGLRFGKVVRADLWNAIQLRSDFKFAGTRRSDIRTALKKGLSSRLAESSGDWELFYALLEENLRDRHGTVPVHSAEELNALHLRLGAASRLMLCFSSSGSLLAGTWLLNYGHGVLHTQYICSSSGGRAVHAVDVVLGAAIEMALAERFRIFSFGTNTQPDGWSINADLMKYKLRFGSGVVVHPTFEYSLTDV